MENNFPDPKYNCCCGSFHVERGAYWIAVVGIVFSTLSIFASAWFYGLMVKQMVSATVIIAAYVGILMALHNRQPRWYLPFLIINGIRMVFIPISILFLLLIFAAPPTFYEQYVLSHLVKEEDTERFAQLIFDVRVFAPFMIAMLVICEALDIWLESVMYHAYRFMKKGKQDQDPY